MSMPAGRSPIAPVSSSDMLFGFAVRTLCLPLSAAPSGGSLACTLFPYANRLRQAPAPRGGSRRQVIRQRASPCPAGTASRKALPDRKGAPHRKAPFILNRIKSGRKYSRAQSRKIAPSGKKIEAAMSDSSRQQNLKVETLYWILLASEEGMSISSIMD